MNLIYFIKGLHKVKLYKKQLSNNFADFNLLFLKKNSKLITNFFDRVLSCKGVDKNKNFESVAAAEINMVNWRIKEDISEFHDIK